MILVFNDHGLALLGRRLQPLHFGQHIVGAIRSGSNLT